MIVVVYVVFVFWPIGWLLARERAGRRFAGHGPWRAVGFDSVAWGRPVRWGPLSPVDALHDVLLALGTFVVGLELTAWLDLAPAGFGVGLVASVLAALAVFAALLFSPLSQQPLVQRLRFTERHLVLDWLREGLHVDEHMVAEAAPYEVVHEVPWEDVRLVAHDRDAEQVIVTHATGELRYGPVDEATAQDIVREASRRAAVADPDVPVRYRQAAAARDRTHA